MATNQRILWSNLVQSLSTTETDMAFIRILFVIFIIKYGSCGMSEEKCGEYSQEFLYERIPIGRPGGATDLRKVSALSGEFPHVVVLGNEDSDGKTRWGFCGGSLISEQFILTAAICTGMVTRPSIPVKYARIGTIDLDKVDGDPNVQTFNVIERYIYPEYKRGFQYHDIGLLKLDNKARFTKYVRPACLFKGFNLPRSIEISAVGWGRPDTNTHDISKNLNKVYLDLFTYDECKDEYVSVKPYGLLDKLMVCAGGRRIPKDTCTGDAGSPLHLYNKDDNIYEIVGITSFGKRCGEIGPGGVYTRVAAYIPWIESIVWPCVDSNTTAQELDEYISSAGVPPKEPPCGKLV